MKILSARSITKNGERYRVAYCLNGWETSKSYFKHFGFSNSDIEDMCSGEVIRRDDNTFSICLKDEYDHNIVPYEVLTEEELEGIL